MNGDFCCRSPHLFIGISKLVTVEVRKSLLCISSEWALVTRTHYFVFTHSKPPLFRVLQSHTTPSYLWNEDYSGRPAPSADSKQRMLRDDPFTPVELPQRSASPVKLTEDGRQKKKRQSSPKHSEGTGSRASLMQKAASKNSKRSSGSSKGGEIINA